MAVPTFDNAMLNRGRLLLDGIPFADLEAASTRPADCTWLAFWSERADHYEALAEAAVEAGHRRSAGECFWLASICAQYAQFLWFDEGRARMQERKAQLYARAAPFLAPEARRFELLVDGVTIPGYVRIPVGTTTPGPCAVLLGGLESTKEESYLFENLLLERGVATVTFDGPGQGEVLAELPLVADFHRYTSRVLDHVVEQEPLIDPARVAVVGRSLGGNYALASAATDPRFAACVSWGGFVTVDWDEEPEHDKASWVYVTRASSLDEARERVVPALDTRPLLGELRCPTYFLHGALDEVPLDQIDLLREWAPNAELDVVVEEQGDHCCHNLGPVPRLAMADWITDRLA